MESEITNNQIDFEQIYYYTGSSNNISYHDNFCQIINGKLGNSLKKEIIDLIRNELKRFIIKEEKNVVV